MSLDEEKEWFAAREAEHKKKKRKRLIVLLLLLLLLLLSFWLQNRLKPKSDNDEPTGFTHVELSSKVLSSEANSSSLLISSSSKKIAKSTASKSKTYKLSVSSEMKSSSTKVIFPSDSIPPSWSFLPPSGAYLEKELELTLKCVNEKCSFEKKDENGEWKSWEQTKKVQLPFNFEIRAVDSVGNYTTQQVNYELSRNLGCKEGMVRIAGGSKDFCVDRYEWPNQKGSKPVQMVNQSTAVEMCASASKRLCSSSEWKSACKGKKKKRFSYGNSYKSSACYTRDSHERRSGTKSMCRNFEGVYDMNGNLWEWTSSESTKKGKYDVVGGHYKSTSRSSCDEKKYSFFPQNQYPSVGFRCCSEVNP